LTFSSGLKVTYVYDQMNRLTQILDDAVPPNVLAAYQYDVHSRRTLLTLANGASTAYTYTRDDETLNMVHTWNNGTTTYIYGFDGNGRRTNLRISNDIFDPWINIPADQTLTSNNLNQLTLINGTTLTYDLNGNLLSDGTHVYTHNAVNRLVGVDGTITYAYDALGRRASKTVNGNITNYVYDGARVIAEYDGAGQLLRKYIYGPGLDEPVLMQSGATRYYYLFDSLGSAIGLTDASGGLVEAYRYSPYGQLFQASSVGKPYMFTKIVAHCWQTMPVVVYCTVRRRCVFEARARHSHDPAPSKNPTSKEYFHGSKARASAVHGHYRIRS
jgi:YD repeat-containing protein